MSQQVDFPDFASVSKAVAWVNQAYAGSLVFLPSAIKGASNCPFKNTLKLVKLLTTLHEVSMDMRSAGGRVTGGLQAALSRSGFAYKPWISMTAAGKHIDDYAFMYQGRRVLFGQHVTLGAGAANTCMSVHFLVEPGTHKIVIGWCGRHGANTSK